MSLWSRITNVFRGDRLNREIDDELQSHFEAAMEQGRAPEEARKAFGSGLRLREESRDLRLIAWLDSLRADALFGLRRLRKTKVTSAAAILSLAQAIGHASFIIRTASANPLVLANALRQEVRRAQSGFRVSNIRTQQEINDSNTIRERLLATLALFFAGVALLLAGIGLYGVLNYSVVQQRREIGIRLAIGAQSSVIARLVTMEVFAMVAAGAAAGLALGLASTRCIETLFYEVKASDARMIAVPALTIIVVALLSSIPAVIQAVRIDHLKMLGIRIKDSSATSRFYAASGARTKGK